MSRSAFESLDALAASLPFHLDDIASANEAFVRWRESGSDTDRRVVQLWTYCFIRRYFLVKFVQETAYSPADLDALIDTTFRKVERSASGIKKPSRYASWVSVVCKNTFLNYLRGRRRAVSLDEAGAPQLAGEPPGVYHDISIAREAVLRAIDRLPPYLQECVRCRFIEGLTYEEIAQRTGYPLPRIRSYINKAVKRFREDEELLAFFDREV